MNKKLLKLMKIQDDFSKNKLTDSNTNIHTIMKRINELENDVNDLKSDLEKGKELFIGKNFSTNVMKIACEEFLSFFVDAISYKKKQINELISLLKQHEKKELKKYENK